MTAGWEEVLQEVARGRMVRTHSARVEPGDVFVALPGTVHDGTRFVSEAVERGAAYVVSGTAVDLPPGSDAVTVVVDDPTRALGELAGTYFQTNASPADIIGVTGTNGKTTVSYLVEHLFSSNGLPVGVVGTVSHRWPGHEKASSMTTPGCWELHELLHEMTQAGAAVVCLEVSSHALAQNRIAGIDFRAGVFTNLTQDHLDYHGDMESYFQAKARLFSREERENMLGVVNLDDAFGRRLADEYDPVLGFSLSGFDCKGPVLQGRILSCDRAGLTLEMQWRSANWQLHSPLIGRHNGSNLLAVQAVGLGLGLEVEQLQVLEQFMGVPGRLERVDNGAGLDIFVDYAHTPDALANVLAAMQEVGFARIITVFGCGGNRDATKRPLMGEAVAAQSDVAVLTSDNPRFEDPESIMDQVMPGLEQCPKVIREVDRRKAIEAAIAEMQPGDGLLIAGKGHETYQQIGEERLPFSDQAVVREIVA